MAKRFTDTNKYKKPFMRSLPAPYKLLWDYLYHDCDHAGIWIVNFEIAQIYIGQDVPVNEEDAIKYFNSGEERIVVIDRGIRWFIPSFIDFQYGTLCKTNNVYKGVARLLEKHDLYDYINIKDDTSSVKSGRNRISRKKRIEVFSQDNFTCQYCRERHDLEGLCVDHIIPLNKDGSKNDENLTTSCHRCNRHKSDILPWEFLLKSHSFLNPTEKIKIAIKSLKGANNTLLGVMDKDSNKDEDKDIININGVEKKSILNPAKFEKLPAYGKIRVYFETKRGLLWGDDEDKHCESLIKKIRHSYRSQDELGTDDQIYDAFLKIVESDQWWVLNSFSMKTLNEKYSEITNSIKHGNSESAIIEATAGHRPGA